MRYTRSAVGLLKSQYRSVLKKCFLINAGLFLFAAPALADDRCTNCTVTEDDGNVIIDYSGHGALNGFDMDENTQLTINNDQINLTLNGEMSGSNYDVVINGGGTSINSAGLTNIIIADGATFFNDSQEISISKIPCIETDNVQAVREYNLNNIQAKSTFVGIKPYINESSLQSDSYSAASGAKAKLVIEPRWFLNVLSSYNEGYIGKEIVLVKNATVDFQLDKGNNQTNVIKVLTKKVDSPETYKYTSLTSEILWTQNFSKEVSYQRTTSRINFELATNGSNNYYDRVKVLRGDTTTEDISYANNYDILYVASELDSAVTFDDEQGPGLPTTRTFLAPKADSVFNAGASGYTNNRYAVLGDSFTIQGKRAWKKIEGVNTEQNAQINMNDRGFDIKEDQYDPPAHKMITENVTFSGASKGLFNVSIDDMETLSFTNTDFLNNSGYGSYPNKNGKRTQTIVGAVISSASDFKIVADDEAGDKTGHTVISDNIYNSKQEKSGYNQEDGDVVGAAIYAQSQDVTMTFETLNNGIITLNDTVSGPKEYNVIITGDGTGTLKIGEKGQFAGLVWEDKEYTIGDADPITVSIAKLAKDASGYATADVTAEKTHIDLQDAGLNKIYLNSLVSANMAEDENAATYGINIDLGYDFGTDTQTDDGSNQIIIKTTPDEVEGKQYVSLNNINFENYAGGEEEFNKLLGKTFTVLHNGEDVGNDVQLTLAKTDEGQNVEELCFVVKSTQGEPYVDKVAQNTKWTDEYTRGTVDEKITGTVQLVKVRTDNDSLQIIEGPMLYDKTVDGVLGDNLVLANINKAGGQSGTISNRTYTFAAYSNVKTVDNTGTDISGQTELGQTSGTLTINGKINNETGNRSTIDVNQYSGFANTSGTLNINQVNIQNANDAFTLSGSAVTNLKNVNLTGNTSTREDLQGAAIYSSANVKLSVDGYYAGIDEETEEQIINGYTSAISDNIGDSAIYMNGANLEFDLAKNGVFEINDVVRGENDYVVNIHSSDEYGGTFVLQSALENANLDTVSRSASGVVNFDVADDITNTYYLSSLQSADNTHFAVDIDLVKAKADLFDTSEYASTVYDSVGTLMLGELNVLSQSSQTMSDINVGDQIKIQVLKNKDGNNGLQLDMTDELREKVSVVTPMGTTYKKVSDEISAITYWNEKYATYNQEFGVNGILQIGTQDTTNDSVVIDVVSLDPGEKTFIGYNGDTLALVNRAELGQEKSFNFDRYSNIYIVEDNLDNSSADTLNINGFLSSTGDKASTINMDGFSGFVIDKAATLNVSDVDIKKASGIDGSAIRVVNRLAKVNLTNVDLTNNTSSGLGGAVYNNGTVNISAENRDVTLAENTANGVSNAIYNTGFLNLQTADDYEILLEDGIDGINGNINIAGKVDLQNTVSNNKIALQNGVLDVSKSSAGFGENSHLDAQGGTILLGTNTITLDNAYFGADSILDLKIRALDDGRHGLVVADNMKILDGAVLKATLGTGLLGGKASAEVRLLSAGNEDFVNNFTDVVKNNMYRLTKKVGDEGVYIITYYKTAEEISRENGGTEDNAIGARNWVDLTPFDEGTVGQEIADGLSELAQSDGKALNRALSAIAPSEAPIVKTASVSNSSRLFNMIGTHLRSNRVIPRTNSIFAPYRTPYGTTYRTYESSSDYYGGKYYGVSSGDNSLKYSTMWAKAYFSSGNYDEDGAVEGFDLKSKGVVLGVDTNLGQSFRIGGGYALDIGEVNNDLRDIDITTHTGFVYGEFKPDRWFANMMGEYSLASYEESKKALGKTFKADYDVDYSSLQFKVGYENIGNYINFIPEAGVRYTSISRDEYTDQTTQRVGASDVTMLTALSGVRLNKSYRMGDSTIVRPHAQLSISYDITSDEDNTVISLKNGRSYTFTTEESDKFGVEGNLGIAFKMNEKLDLDMNYIGTWKGKYIEHTGEMGVKCKF